MRVEELSIGDWVKVLNYHWDGTSFADQVEGITKKHGTYYLQFGSSLYAEIDRCEPIPITPEILERNGFSGEMYAFCKINDEQWLEYYYHEHRLRKWWRGIDEWNNHADVTEVTFECHCHYVHELQMAFKLCKVNKEIVL